MFTSRAEYRLLLREDNADLRLTAKGRELGLVKETQWRLFEQKQNAIEQETQRLSRLWIRPEDEQMRPILEKTSIRREITCLELLRRPEVSYQDLMQLSMMDIDPKVSEQIEIQVKYKGYIDRQQLEIQRSRRYEETVLPNHIDYSKIKGLSSEVQQKLITQRPSTIGQASRIPGMTPAAVSLLLVHLKKTTLSKG
jgi:tRNA uridine 5-carboxymethylaminomethyl modification enzyme